MILKHEKHIDLYIAYLHKSTFHQWQTNGYMWGV